MKKILVITPIYNTEKFLRGSIESTLQQEGVYVHLVLVDDCSTDNSLKIAKEYEHLDNVTILSNTENRGAYYSRNKGLDFLNEDQFDFFTVFDSDDLADINRLKIIIDNFEPNTLSVTANYIRVNEDLTPIKLPNGTYDIYNSEGQTVFKSEVFQFLGYYKNLRHSGDTDYKLRLEGFCKKNPTYNTKQINNILSYAINRNDNSNLTKQYNISSRREVYIKIKQEVLEMYKLNNFYREKFI
jgi:glycosyltransferase involved in cell wall biosynthesis